MFGGSSNTKNYEKELAEAKALLEEKDKRIEALEHKYNELQIAYAELEEKCFIEALDLLNAGVVQCVKEIQGDIESNLDVNQKSIEYVEENIAQINELDAVSKNISNSLNMIAQSSNRSRATAENLNKSVDEISNVINLIKDISDQTNLLALNAAIEASIAGEMAIGAFSVE